jgi:transcriptional regulator
MAQFTTIQRHSFIRIPKPATGKVVPNWDYEAVQVYGTARIYFDTKSEEFGDFLTQQLSDLSQYAETSIMGYGSGAKS